MDFSALGNLIMAKWPIVTSIVAVLYIIEKLLETIGAAFKITLVDNIGVYLGQVLSALFPKQKPPAA